MEGMECVDRENVSPEVLNGGESSIANSRCWEAQEGDASTVSVRGRLGACITYWEEVLYAPPWVLETLRNGYPGEKNGVIARNCARKTAITTPNYAVFKTLYLLDCAI